MLGKVLKGIGILLGRFLVFYLIGIVVKYSVSALHELGHYLVAFIALAIYKGGKGYIYNLPFLSIFTIAFVVYPPILIKEALVTRVPKNPSDVVQALFLLGGLISGNYGPKIIFISTIVVFVAIFIYVGIKKKFFATVWYNVSHLISCKW